MEIHLTVREEKDMTRGLPGTLGTSGNKLASVNSSINQSINQLCNIRGQVDMWQNYEVLPHFQLAYIYKYICVWTWYDSKKNRVNLGIWFNWVTPSHVMGHHKREDRYIYLAFLVRSSWDWERLPPPSPPPPPAWVFFLFEGFSNKSDYHFASKKCDWRSSFIPTKILSHKKLCFVLPRMRPPVMNTRSQFQPKIKTEVFVSPPPS